MSLRKRWPFLLILYAVALVLILLHIHPGDRTPTSSEAATIYHGVEGADNKPRQFYTLDSASPVSGYGSDASLHLQSVLGFERPYSDTAYLEHCKLSSLNSTAFVRFRHSLLKEAKVNYLSYKMKINVTDVKDEVILQGLEIFARASGVCNFSLYTPTVPVTTGEQVQLNTLVQRLPVPPPNEVRLVYCISVFGDFPQLKALVDAITLPQHLLIVHLERRTPVELVNKVRDLSRSHPNLLVLKYGSITYPTDSLSQVFLQIMRLVTSTLKVEYDYVVTLGASAYPLWEAHELAQKLYAEERYVRIGRMVYHGGLKRLCKRHASSFGVVLSRGMGPKKLVPLNGLLRSHADTSMLKAEKFLPPKLNLCRKKTNSGNTAAFDRAAVETLLVSAPAMSFLSRFKQSGKWFLNHKHSSTLAILPRSKDSYFWLSVHFSPSRSLLQRRAVLGWSSSYYR